MRAGQDAMFDVNVPRLGKRRRTVELATMMKQIRRHHRSRRRTPDLFAEPLESRRMFDMVYPGDGSTPPPEEPASYVLGSKWSTTNLTYSFSNLFDGGMPGGLSS